MNPPLTSGPQRHGERGSPGSTSKFAARFTGDFEPAFFRKATFDLTVSSIGAGSYLGQCTDEDDAAYGRALSDAFARGINFIDTAPNYRAQRSERVIGVALAAAIADGTVERSEVVICTKGGYIPLDGNIPATREEYQSYLQRVFLEPGVLHPDEIVGGGHSIAPRFLRYSIALSRQNLGLRTIDLYYLHNPEQQLGTVSLEALRVRIRAAFGALEEAASRGEIGCYGCSTWNALRVAAGSPGHLSLSWLIDIAKEVAGETHRFRAVQLPINLAMPEGIRDSLQKISPGVTLTAVQAANEHGLSVIGSAPLMQGRLAAGLPDTVRTLFPNHRTDAQRAISFVRSLPGIVSTVVGARGLAHLEENLESARAVPNASE